MFSDDFNKNSNAEQNDKISNLDLGISNKYENVGYYAPQLGEIINQKYKVIGLCGKGIFSSVVKVVDITSNIGYALKIIRNIDIMKASGDKERNIISLLNKDDKEGIFYIFIFSDKSCVIQLVNTFEFNNHICMIFPLFKMNLRDLIKGTKNKGLSLDLVKLFAKQLISAFIHIHKNKLIHADCNFLFNCLYS